jgi:hypothetical protein
MRRKAPHWLERYGQAGEPHARKLRQLGGKSRCVGRHVVAVGFDEKHEWGYGWQVPRLRTAKKRLREVSCFQIGSMTRLFYRCGQPAQQHGRRIPPFILDSAFFIRISRVSAFTPEVTQQIHSLRASGVMSSHNSRAAGAAIIAFFRSSGSLCTVPVESVLMTRSLSVLRS